MHDAEHSIHGERQVRNIQIFIMKKLQSLDSMLFKTLEASEMKAVTGGEFQASNTGTLAGVTVFTDGTSATDSPANPNDGADDN